MVDCPLCKVKGEERGGREWYWAVRCAGQYKKRGRGIERCSAVRFAELREKREMKGVVFGSPLRGA